MLRRRYQPPDRRRHRVRRPPPTEGFLVADLARLAGVSIPTLKRYVRHGLLAPVPFRGTATRYPPDYLVRVLALRCWRASGLRTLAELRRRLDAVSFAEMLTWVMSHPMSADTAAALQAAADGAASPAAVPGGVPAVSPSSSLDAPDAAPPMPAESWQRWALMPGLEIHLKSDAAPVTRQMAARLYRAFASLVNPQTQ